MHLCPMHDCPATLLPLLLLLLPLLLLLLQELGESTGQLKQLVKQNFERFIRWDLPVA